MKNDVKKELEALSPTLAKLHQSKPVPKLPENLFHNMQQSVIQKLKKEEKAVIKSPKPIWWKTIFRPVPTLVFATSLALIIAVFYFSGDSQSTSEIAFSEITDDEILAYIDNNIQDFEAANLIELYEEEDDDIFDIELDETELNDYLDNHVDEFEETSLEQIF